MKPEEAIKILQKHIDLIKQDWSYIQYRKAFERAVKALKKQITMKPDNIKSILDFFGRYYTTKGNCPFCNREGLYKSDFYCNKCGQKLDWGEEDDR